MKPCPSCGRELSETAETCPNCGHKMKNGVSVVRIAALLFILMAMYVIYQAFQP